MGSVNATLVTSATTATAPQRRRPAFQMTGRCAAGGATACAAAVSAQSRGPLETPVKNAPPAPMPVALKGEVCCRNTPHCNERFVPLVETKLFNNQSGIITCILVALVSFDGGAGWVYYMRRKVEN